MSKRYLLETKVELQNIRSIIKVTTNLNLKSKSFNLFFLTYCRLDIELEGLVITNNLIEVTVDHNKFNMLEFTCKKNGSYFFNIDFEIYNFKYSYSG